MGRSMLIIASGAVIIFGMIQLGLTNQKEMITANSSAYAKIVHSKNTAFTAIQMAMEEINNDDDWQPTENDPWVIDLNETEVTLWYEIIGAGATPMDPDTIRMHSSSVFGRETAEIVSTYEKTLIDFVPEFKSAMSFATENFSFSMSGNSSISGNDASGTCPDKPAIAVQSIAAAAKVDDGAGTKMNDIMSDSGAVAIDPTLSYENISELIARLESLDGSVQVSGSYKDGLGTINDPGVFFVNEYAKLTGGIDEGYGIMVVRSGGSLAYDSAGVELSIAGNFTFNGLIIFEDAYNLTGTGTPTINGSVLVGNSDSSNANLDVDVGGNLSVQYNCEAEGYAKAASAGLLNQNRYTRMNTFE